MWISFPIKYQYQFLQLSEKFEQKSEPEDAIYIPAQKEIDNFLPNEALLVKSVFSTCQ